MDEQLSGLVVEVPEADQVLGEHRRRIDIGVRLGVPAHVTVLFPFVSPKGITGGTLGRLADLFAPVDSFSYRFDRTAWFGDAVLWLAPAVPEPFISLTGLATAAFPGYLPYGGQFSEVTPHLTVGHGSELTAMKAAEPEIEAKLPIEGRARGVTLLTQGEPGGQWSVTARFPFRASRAAPADGSPVP
jgi:hypothetical protein